MRFNGRGQVINRYPVTSNRVPQSACESRHFNCHFRCLIMLVCWISWDVFSLKPLWREFEVRKNRSCCLVALTNLGFWEIKTWNIREGKGRIYLACTFFACLTTSSKTNWLRSNSTILTTFLINTATFLLTASLWLLGNQFLVVMTNKAA